MYKVFVADKLAAEGVQALESYPDLEVDFSPGLSEEEAILHARDADAIVVRSATKIKGELLAAAKRLRVVGRAGIGVDNIDVEAATERGIVVLNTPDANATTTAELAIAHMFSLSRHLTAADRSVRSGEWNRSTYVGTEISGKTVGIVGFGTIGRLVAMRCRGLQMRVIAFDPFVTEETFAEYGVDSETLEDLLRQADYVTLHCPLTDDTRNLLNRDSIATMKRGARLINCARGGLIDEDALVEAIDSGQLSGAALDVFANEPPGETALFERPQITFTPHLGASTHEAQAAVGVEIAHQIAAYLIRGEVTNAVNVPSIAPDELQRVGPYLLLARQLGKLLCMMVDEPLKAVEVGFFGNATELERQPIVNEVLVGILQDHLSIPVNHVNAEYLARRQGLHISEMGSSESRDYLSILRVSGTMGDSTLCLEGTLFDERHPRLVRVNDYVIEATLEGQVILTRHQDKPGVIGAIGATLGEAGINISRMQVGIADDTDHAIAVIAVSEEVPAETIRALADIDAIDKVLHTEFRG